MKHYPNAIHHYSYQLYASDWRPEDVLVFEHILFTVRHSRKVVLDLSKEKIQRETRLSRRYVENAFKRLEKKGFLVLQRHSQNQFGMKYFFNLKAIIDRIDEVYDFSNVFEHQGEIDFFRINRIEWLKKEIGRGIFHKVTERYREIV